LYSHAILSFLKYFLSKVLHQLEQMNDPVFDTIRNTPEFVEIEKSLQQYAKKH